MKQCLACGDSETVLIEVLDIGQRPFYLCDYCHGEFVKGYFMVAYCDNCEVEIITEDTDPPYYCRLCDQWVNKIVKDGGSIPMQDLANKMALTSEDWERSPLARERGSSMCVRRAIREYVHAHKDEDRNIIRERAKARFRELYDVPDDLTVVTKIMSTAKEFNISSREFLDALAACDLINEATEEIIAIAKEMGYKAFDAIENDHECDAYGYPSSFYAEYLVKTKESFCLEKDDDLSDLPF